MTNKKNKFNVFSMLLGIVIGFSIALLFFHNNWAPFSPNILNVHDTIAVATNPLSDCDSSAFPASDPKMGIKIDESQLTALNSRFLGMFNNNTTQGGNISKCMVAAILRSLPEDEAYMPYYFGFEDNKMVLILKGGDQNSARNSNGGTTAAGSTPPPPLPSSKLIYRTGTDDDCFCPTQCR